MFFNNGCLGGFFMALGDLLKRNIDFENFQGIVIRVGSKSEVHWWSPGQTKINRLLLDIKISNPVSFNCVEGKLKILDV